MKQLPPRRTVAPTPRLTLWVPAGLAMLLSLAWLGLLAIIPL